MELYSDTYYIKKILDGDESYFACLLDKYNRQVFTLIYRIVGNREDAEELTQDVFMKVFKNLATFKGESSFSTWIYRIAYNISISKTRKHEESTLSIEEGLISEDEEERISNELSEDEDAQRLDLLERALQLLQKDEKAIMLLFYKEEKSIEEISHITGLSIVNVKVRLHRTRKKLMSLIEKIRQEL